MTSELHLAYYGTEEPIAGEPATCRPASSPPSWWTAICAPSDIGGREVLRAVSYRGARHLVGHLDPIITRAGGRGWARRLRRALPGPLHRWRTAQSWSMTRPSSAAPTAPSASAPRRRLPGRRFPHQSLRLHHPASDRRPRRASRPRSPMSTARSSMPRFPDLIEPAAAFHGDAGDQPSGGARGAGDLPHGGRQLRDGGPAQLVGRLLQDLCPPARSALALCAAGRRAACASWCGWTSQSGEGASAARERDDEPVRVTLAVRTGRVCRPSGW